MKKLLLPILFLLSCGTTQQVTGPTVYVPSPPIHDTISVIHTVYVDSVTIDTLNALAHDTILVAVPITVSPIPVAYLTPSPTGDDYPQLQAAINDFIDGGPRIELSKGDFWISKPLIDAKIVNGQYVQVSLNIRGASNAANAPGTYVTIIHTRYRNCFALGIQLGKGIEIHDIGFMGMYPFPNSLSQNQIITLPWAAWSDGITSDGRTNPHCGIAIDPFSDSTFFDNNIYKMYDGLHQWYIPGMSRSGSTHVNITGCGFNDFVVGIVVSPSWQFNGELVNIEDVRADYCRASIAWTQAQSKENHITRLMSWGNTHTVLDGMHFGYWRGDGSTAPVIDGVSLAGVNYQLIQAEAYTFQLNLHNVYGEGLFKIGSVVGWKGMLCESCEVDFLQSDPGCPYPDYFFDGEGITWINPGFRVYGGNFGRITMNSHWNIFKGGSFGLPPVVMNDQGQLPTFENTMIYYGSGPLTTNNYDTLLQMGNYWIRTEKETFTGYIVTSNAYLFHEGDMLYTSAFNDQGDVPNFVLVKPNNWYPVGSVESIGTDTVYIQQMGIGIVDSSEIAVRAVRYKSGFVY